MRTVTVYKADGTKVDYKKGEVPSRKDLDYLNQGTMSERVLRGYYQREIEQGSRFQSGYRKSIIKRAHENKIAEQEWKPQPRPD